ncbi:MAG TPA: hypothetical protein VF169_18200 [Albitalea sp.]|uniref:hypothetical protein n=1 Tax=Piscinibacter sp. TaxID=1903157 RepID=UPI002ED4CAEB
MLTDATVSSFVTLSGIARDRALHAFGEKARGLAADLNVKGLMFSSVHLLQLDRLAAETIQDSAAQMFGSLATAQGVEPASDAVQRTSQLQQLFAAQLSDLGERIIAARDEKFHSIEQRLSRSFDLPGARTALDQEQAAYRARIQMLVAGMANTGASARSVMSNTFNIGAPVGSIQTGAGSTAAVQQTNTVGVPADVVRAIESLVQAVVASSLAAGERAEIEEVLTEIKAEVQKPKPNASKLRGLVGGARTALETIPQVGAALEQLSAWVETIRSAI